MYTIDASVFVTATEAHEIDFAVSRQLLGVLYRRRIPLIVPTLVIVEVAGTISRLRGAAHAHRIVQVLYRMRPQLVPLDESLAQIGSSLAGDYRLRGADAVYAAVAQVYQTTLVSRDREHLNRLSGIIPVQHPAHTLALL